LIHDEKEDVTVFVDLIVSVCLSRKRKMLS